MPHRAGTCLFLALSTTALAYSQAPVTTTGGAPGSVAVFSGSASILNANITQGNNGYVGIANTNPLAPLAIGGNVFISNQFNYRGDASLHISGVQGCCGRLTQLEAYAPSTDALNIMSSTTSDGSPKWWTWGVSQGKWMINAGLLFGQNPGLTVADTGFVGIGVTSPGANLEVNGNVKLSTNSGASITFPDGTVQSTAWNGTLPGGDYAESVDVLGARNTYEPGDVIAINDSGSGKFSKSDAAYSKLVAGVYSTKPGLLGRRVGATPLDKDAQVPLAMMGIVPIKVTAENGPLNRGDLLVSASTPGFAMKGTDRERLTGAVIGKALAPLASGTGLIEVLLALQ